MQLELIEEKALNYLGQVTNPLVRIDVLHAHLMEADSVEAILPSDLEEFLAHHELIKVIKPLPQEADGTTAEPGPDDASGPFSYVILNTRVPTEQQTAAMMLDQLNSMHEALAIAKAQARDNADFNRLAEVDDALERVEGLIQKLTASLKPPGSAS